MGITSFAYIPLSSSDPAEAAKLAHAMEDYVDGLKENSQTPPGRVAQFDIQASVFRDDALPDMEIVPFPGLFMAECNASIFHNCAQAYLTSTLSASQFRQAICLSHRDLKPPLVSRDDSKRRFSDQSSVD